jgi:hypothetical protein
MVRVGVLVLLASLGLQIGEIPILAAVAPYDVDTISSPHIRTQDDVLPVTLRQTADAPVAGPAEPTTDAELGRIAVLTTMLNQQGAQSLGNLERVSSIEVLNRTLRPEFVVDARMERVAAASAASEAAALEATRSAELAAEAQAEADAAVAAALAADQADDEARTLTAQAAASATRVAETAAVAATREAETATLAATREAEALAAVATRTADAQAAASAIREAEASAAAATALAEAEAAAAAAGSHQFSQRVMMVLLSLALLVGSFLGLRYWRNRKEPFVLKAVPVTVTAQAHA